MGVWGIVEQKSQLFSLFAASASVAGAICDCSRGARLAAAVESLLRVARGSPRVVAGWWSRCNSSSLVRQGESSDATTVRRCRRNSRGRGKATAGVTSLLHTEPSPTSNRPATPRAHDSDYTQPCLCDALIGTAHGSAARATWSPSRAAGPHSQTTSSSK